MGEDLTPKTIFEQKIPENIQKDPEKAKSVNAIYEFEITGDNGGTWTVDLTGDPKVSEGSSGNAGCTITVGDQDFVDIVSGKLNSQMAFMSGKLKIKGDMSLAMKLGKVLG